MRPLLTLMVMALAVLAQDMAMLDMAAVMAVAMAAVILLAAMAVMLVMVRNKQWLNNGQKTSS